MGKIPETALHTDIRDTQGFLKEQLGAAQEKTDEPVDENDPMAKLLKEFESYLGDKVMDMAGDIAKDVIKDTIGMATSGNDD